MGGLMAALWDAIEPAMRVFLETLAGVPSPFCVRALLHAHRHSVRLPPLISCIEWCVIGVGDAWGVWHQDALNQLYACACVWGGDESVP